MARDTDKRHEELRRNLVTIAEAQIKTSGLASLRARALANKARCAVGAIYNVFDDMTGLVLAVNWQTFRRLGAFVGDIIEADGGTGPTDRMVTIGIAYLQFASTNPNLWRALFEVKMPADRDIPQWYLEELSRLFSIIADPLSEVYPDADGAEIDLMTRALFSSVHGIVTLGLENRISGVPQNRIEAMIEYVIRNVTSPG
ncbi:MAG: TetR/AcrR family transcriptional regulator [Boseongicola sp.]